MNGFVPIHTPPPLLNHPVDVITADGKYYEDCRFVSDGEVRFCSCGNHSIDYNFVYYQSDGSDEVVFYRNREPEPEGEMIVRWFEGLGVRMLK